MCTKQLPIELVFDSYSLQAGVVPLKYERKNELWLFSTEFVEGKREIARLCLHRRDELIFVRDVLKICPVAVEELHIPNIEFKEDISEINPKSVTEMDRLHTPYYKPEAGVRQVWTAIEQNMEEDDGSSELAIF